jgi:hypothetical protein
MAAQRNEGTQCKGTTGSGNQCKRITTGEYCDSHAPQAQDRTTRDQSSRTGNQRKSDSWIPSSQLPMPNPVDGWEFRYIRTSTLDKADTKNVSRRFREGWVPVVASEHPELEVESDIGSKYESGVEIGGLLLCKIPTETVRARNKYFDDLAKQQLESVDHGFMNEQDPRMPKHNESKKSRTDFRRG